MGNLINKNIKNNIKKMSIRNLELLTYEIRDFLIASVSRTGGHLASNLGVVELTLALHRVFDIGKDKIVWDIGHQTYVHKILTSRSGRFSTLRKFGGLSGFPKTSEDPADVYNSGHSSTSISAAMGLAEARDIRGEKHHVVAVVGDGALTGGLAYEGLNKAGNHQTRLIVVLNDNEMSISEKTGVTQYLSKLRASQAYRSTKNAIRERMARIPRVGESMVLGAERMKNLMRYAVVPGSFFEELGFKYYGPVDGHNLRELISLLEAVKLMDGPVLIHVLTKKGKGYVNAENTPGYFKVAEPFDTETGMALARKKGKDWCEAAGEIMIGLAESDQRVVCVSATAPEDVGLSGFEKSYFRHFYDASVAEEHAVTFAAGLALGGLRPFVFVYSTFLQRAYDQIIHEVCSQKLPVVFMIDRAGNVGRDGETHHGVFDLSFLRHAPGLIVMAPKDTDELKAMAVYALSLGRPVAIRYPIGEAPSKPLSGKLRPLEAGASERLAGDGAGVEIFAIGKMVQTAIKAAAILKKAGIDAGVVNARFAAPVDEATLCEAAGRGAVIVTIEDNVLSGGFGESACAALARNGMAAPMLVLGWPDEFIPHGDVAELMAKYGLDPAGVAASIQEFLRNISRKESERESFDERAD